MKRFYLPVLLCLLLTCLSTHSLLAQSPWPGGLPPAAKAMRTVNSICLVDADYLWPNSLVIVYDVTLLPIGISISDTAGSADIVYLCGYSPYSLTTCSSTSGCLNVLITPEVSLPVKLTNFSAEISSGNTVILNWTSEFELNSYAYVIQKSDDGKKFTDIGEIKAAGSSDKPVKYHFADINFNGGVSYFRLKLMDIDGKAEYSKVVYANNKKASGLVKSVAPNPFISDVHLIGISSAELTNKNIRVFNAFGQTVSYRITGANSITIDPSAPSGVYYIKVKEQTFKLFKK
jgi:hypothetical protein